MEPQEIKFRFKNTKTGQIIDKVSLNKEENNKFPNNKQLEPDKDIVVFSNGRLGIYEKYPGGEEFISVLKKDWVIYETD